MKSSRRSYADFVKKGIAQGKRPDLVGGGLVRSAGGWTALKALRRSGFRQKADERMLGDGEFVTGVLKEANERLDRKYRLRSEGFDFDKVVSKVAVLLEIEPHQAVSSGKCRHEVEARDIICYWASTELGISQVNLAKKFGVSQPAICTAIRRGNKIIREKELKLDNL